MAPMYFDGFYGIWASLRGFNALIVMIGLSFSLTAVFMGVYAALHGGSGGSIASGIGGACGLGIFALWYCGLLIWFNNSFS